MLCLLVVIKIELGTIFRENNNKGNKDDGDFTKTVPLFSISDWRVLYLEIQQKPVPTPLAINYHTITQLLKLLLNRTRNKNPFSHTQWSSLYRFIA